MSSQSVAANSGLNHSITHYMFQTLKNDCSYIIGFQSSLTGWESTSNLLQTSEAGKTKATLNHVSHTEDIHHKKQENYEDRMYRG